MTVETTMNFALGDIEGVGGAAEAAKQAEFTGGNFVKEPGAYTGIVETAIFKKFPSGAGGVEIAIKTEEGTICKVMIITMKKDGTSTYKNGKGELMPLPGINQIRGSLMPCLRQKELAVTQSGDDFIYTSVVGRPLGMLVNIRKTLGKTNGKPDPKKVYDNADLKTFFCPKTNLCGSEILNKVAKPERMEKIKKSLKTVDETNIPAASAASNPADPFGDANASGSVADPFAESNDSVNTNTVDDTAIKAEAAAKAKADADAAAKLEAEAKAKAEVDAAASTETTTSEGSALVDDFWK